MSIRAWRLWIAAALCAPTAACGPSSRPALRSTTGFAQGTSYSLQWVGGGGEAVIAAAAAQELERIDALLSNYQPGSTLERFNATKTTEPFELPSELVELLALAKSTHAASSGCFDPTVRPLVRAWGFDSDAPTVPSPDVVAAARAVVGLDKLELPDATHARKREPELALDMASIGQGYTAARLAALLEQHGSTAYLAEIGGEVVARGTKPGDVPWRVGIENPGEDGASPALRIPAGAATAVVTSGSYRQYFEAEGRRFGHIIDPRTGWPVEHGLVAATVVGRDAAAAAAWGTALLCLGPAEALATAERHAIAAVLWIDDGSGEVSLEVTPSFAADWRSFFDVP